MIWLALGFALGWFIGRWDESHAITRRGRWERLRHALGKHYPSEYSGLCVWCDRQVAEPNPRDESNLPDWMKTVHRPSPDA